MSRLPLSPTGLAPLLRQPTVTDNPFVAGDAANGDAITASIIAASQANPGNQEYQDMLGRALFAQTGISRDPTTRGERLERDAIIAQERSERARIAKAAADPDEPLTQEAVQALTEQHNQRWSTYSFVTEMPSPVSIYAQKAAEQDPAVRFPKISSALKTYQETGEIDETGFALMMGPDVPAEDKTFLEKRMASIDKRKAEVAKAGIDRQKDVGATLEKIYENKDDPAGQQVLYNQLRLKYPDLPAIQPDAKFEDYQFTLAGRQLGLQPPQPERPGFISRLIFGEPPVSPSSAPAPEFANRQPTGGDAPIDTRRMTAEQKKALLEEVRQTGQPRMVIRRDGSIGRLTP